MIWRKGCPRATPAEFERMDLIRSMGCMCCALKGDVSTGKTIEVHHVKSGNKRLGHLYTIPLCSAHHRGARGDRDAKDPYVHGGMKAFREFFGYDDLQLWQRLQVVLGQDDTLPTSKIVPRRLPAALSEAEKSL